MHLTNQDTIHWSQKCPHLVVPLYAGHNTTCSVLQVGCQLQNANALES